MATIATNERMTLTDRGIWVQHDGAAGLNITLTTCGLWWLFNYLAQSNRKGERLNLDLFKALAGWEPDRSRMRELRAIAPALPTHESGSMYRRLSLYLNASPVTWLHDFPPESGTIHNTYSISRGSDRGGVGVFTLTGAQSLHIKFAADEAAKLNSGGHLEVTETITEAVEA